MKPEGIIQPGSTGKPASTAQLQLPIFFVQLGRHVNLFFDQVLKEARLSNGRENVYVLTDTNPHLYAGYNCIDVTRYMQGREFDRLYRHHSANKYFFEKACFDRWFIINEVVKELNIPYFFHADGDVLILEDLKPFYTEHLQNVYEGSMMYFEDGGRSITSGHSSFWSSKLLNEFCDFVCEKYADEQAFGKILNEAQAGVFYDNVNVSDMILLDVFRRERQTNTLNLFLSEDAGRCFDFNINVTYNGRRHSFIMNRWYHIKQITRRTGSSYAQLADGRQYLFYTLHFQGYLTKALIPLHVTSRNNYEQLSNRLLSARNYTIRKLKLSKNRLKGFIKKILQR